MSKSQNPTSMQTYFHDLVPVLRQSAKAGEFFAASFSAEDSDFCRFNHGLVRQAGHVAQRTLEIRLLINKKQMRTHVSLSGVLSEDKVRIAAAFESARLFAPALPEDPYALFAEVVKSTELIDSNKLPPPQQAVTSILDQVKKQDFVGIYSGGGIYRGFANSFGQTNWFETYNFNLDWSIYVREDKAAKSGLSGKEWSAEKFASKMTELTPQLEALNRPQKTIKPGEFRAYFTPAAISEFLGILSWGGFGLRSQKTKASPLLKLVEGQITVSPLVSINENTKNGASANFDSFGFTKPDNVPLISNGAHSGALISASTGKEYNSTPNGAAEWESPNSVEMAAGTLNSHEIVQKLDTGIFVNNLWYLNYSDRSNCRITGMTRFATFWVENGEIIAPLSVMRFDDSFYKIFGAKLLGLTHEREFMLDPATYEHRSTSSFHLPGALIADLAFTL